MTQRLIDELESTGMNVCLVDRRFSRSAGDVGQFSFRKIAAAITLTIRTLRAAVHFRRRPWIFFVTNRPFSLLVDTALFAILRACGVHPIAYVHTSGYSALPRGLAACAAFNLRACKRVVVLGESLIDDLLPYVDRDVIDIIPNATPPARSDASGPDRARPRVLFLSNLIAGKGHDVFIELAEILSSQDSTIEFVLAGPASYDGQLEEIRRDVQSRGLDGRVEVVGGVYGTDKDELLASAAVLVFPSSYALEAQPLTILEAYASSTPVVAYDVGGLRDLISKATGSLVPVGRVNLLAEAVGEMIRDRESLAALQRHVRTVHAERYSLDHFRESWLAVLERSMSAPD